MTEPVETRWWWIRHAPVVGSDGRVYGQTDLHADCTDPGVFQGLARILPPDPVLVTSDLSRAVQTAKAIAEAGLSMPEPIREQALREQHFGDWQGVPRADLIARRGPERRHFWLTAAFERAPNGESFADLLARVAPVVTRMTVEHRGRDIVCVAHGGTIRAALAIALGLDPETALAFTIGNCSVTRIDHIGRNDGIAGAWRVTMVNRAPA